MTCHPAFLEVFNSLISRLGKSSGALQGHKYSRSRGPDPDRNLFDRLLCYDIYGSGDCRRTEKGRSATTHNLKNGHFWSPFHAITASLFRKLLINTDDSIGYRHLASMSYKINFVITTQIKKSVKYSVGTIFQRIWH